MNKQASLPEAVVALAWGQGQPRKVIYQVRVKDQHGPRGHNVVEEWDVTTKAEADNWLKQFRAEYPKDDGYTISCKKVLV